MSNRSFYGTGAAVLALGVCIHLFFLSRGFYSISWDESARILDAHIWVTQGTVMERAWLPFYRVVVGLALRVFPDLVVTPRVISFLFGFGSILAAAWLAQELFQNRTTTLLTLTLATFFSQRVALSLAPLSDILFTSVMLVTMALFARWLRDGARSFLFWCGLAGTVGAAVRFEGWVFCAVLFLVAAGFRPMTAPGAGRRDLLVFGVILCSFPALWAANMFPTANPVSVVAGVAERYSVQEIVRRNTFTEFVAGNMVTLNLIGFVAVLHFIRRGERRHRATIAASFGALVMVSVILLLTRSAATGPTWRMTCVWGMLLMPFTACLLAGRAWAPAGRRTGKVLASGVTVLVLGAFVNDTFRIERAASPWAFPEWERQAAGYLNGRITSNPKAKVLIESTDFMFLNLKVASQYPESFVNNSIPGWEKAPIVSPGSLEAEALEKRGIGLLVFQTEEYKEFLDGSQGVTKLREFGRWSVYELTRGT